MSDSAIKSAKDMMFSDTSLDFYLTRLFANYGVPRPAANPSDDTMFRQIGQLLAVQPKTKGVRVVYQLLQILFGTQASIIALNRRPWQIYETKPNVLTVEIPQDLIVANTTNATFLHGLGGNDGSSGGGPTNQFIVTRAEDFTQAAAPMVGLKLYINGTPFTISGLTYSNGVNTFTTIGNITPNLASASWYVSIPAAFSFPGSYILRDATHKEAEVNNQPVILFGPGLIDIFVQYMTQITKAAGVVLDMQVVGSGYIHPNPSPPATLASITITPANPSALASGWTQQFTATANFTSGPSQNYTTLVTWSSSDTPVLTISNGTPDPFGFARGVGPGQAVIIAKYPNGPAGTTLVTLS